MDEWIFLIIGIMMLVGGGCIFGQAQWSKSPMFVGVVGFIMAMIGAGAVIVAYELALRLTAQGG